MKRRSPSPPGARRAVFVTAALVFAALFRLALVPCHGLTADDATIALMAKHVLEGKDFPVFFYRQTFVGSLNGFHLVPTLFVFGPSVLFVRLNAVAFSLVFPLGLYLLGRRVFDEATARIALLLAAAPPFVLALWSTTVAEPHLMINVSAILVLLLAVDALDAREARRTRVLACLGLTAGVAWWGNFSVLQAFVPALLVLASRDARLLRGPAGAALGTGFLLGSLPAWLFYAVHGDPTGRVSQIFAPELALSADRLAAVLRTAHTMLLGWYYWPPDTFVRGAAGLISVAAYGIACGAALVEAVRARRGAVSARERAVWLLLLIPPVSFAMLYASRHVDIRREMTHYVLPAYIPLLLFAAALGSRLWRRSRFAGAALISFLFAYNVWTNVAFMGILDEAERARRAAHAASREAIARHLTAHPVEALYTAAPSASLTWAFLRTAPPSSELTREFYLPNALAADAAERIAILLDGSDDGIARALDALGATYRTARFGTSRLLDEIRVPPRGYRSLPREAWRLRGARDAAPAVADGDLGTAAPPPPATTPDHPEVIVDLGSASRVGRVIWWPSADSAHSRPLAVSVSLDGTTWDPIGVLPSADRERRPAFVAGGRPFFRPRNGWLEVRLAPRPVRYLRFAPAAVGPDHWGIAELYVYEDRGTAPDPRPPVEDLVAQLQARRLRRLLADPAVSARVGRATHGAIRTRIANHFLDSHGRATPPARLAEVVGLESTDGLLVPQEDAADLRVRLARQGITFVAEPIGGYVLFHGLSPTASPWAWAGRTLFEFSGRAEPSR